MMFRGFIVIAAISVPALFADLNACAWAQLPAVEGQQQMADFSLSGFGEKGRKNWDLAGRQADIAKEVIKLNDIVSNFYGERENMKLTAQSGDFDRSKGSMHLEKDVVITTSSGARLTTNSLDWDRKEQLVTTADPVNIVKDDLIIDGLGARANTEFNLVNLEKDVRVRIDNPGFAGGLKKEKIEINCDGPLEVDYQKNLATFKNNVKVNTRDGLIESDEMEVYFSSGNEKKNKVAQPQAEELNGSKIEKIIARGNVKVTRGQNVSFSQQAVYHSADRRIVLSGRPKLVIYSSEGLDAPLGN